MEVIGLLGQVLAVALTTLFIVNLAVDAARERHRRRHTTQQREGAGPGLYAAALILLTQATSVRLNLERLEAEMRCRQ